MSDVSFILVYVDDVVASEAFYASILGRGAIESSPTFAMLPAAPGVMLGLWKRDGVKPPAARASGEIAFSAANDAETAKKATQKYCCHFSGVKIPLVKVELSEFRMHNPGANSHNIRDRKSVV